MTMMTLLYQSGRRAQLDHLAAMDLCASKDDIDLVTWAFLNEKPTLVGLDGEACIIKPEEPGDDGMSFDGLLDNALTPREFRRMREHKVKDPKAIGDVLYKVTLIAHIPRPLRAACLLRAKDEHEMRVKIRALVNDETFREKLTGALFEHMLAMQEEAQLASSGALKIHDPAPADAPEWEFLTHPDDE